jgi:hypothetical protein
LRKRILFATTSLFIVAVGLGCAQTSTPSKRQPTKASPSSGSSTPSGQFSQVSELRATPSTIPFVANSPGSAISGGSVATITWNIAQGSLGRTWTLMVGTSSPTFSGCATVPESAVSVRCVSASVVGGGQGSAGCNVTDFTPLPASLPGVSMASGNEGNASAHSYNVVLSYQLTDSWRYGANVCPLNVSYTVVAQ